MPGIISFIWWRLRFLWILLQFASDTIFSSLTWFLQFTIVREKRKTPSTVIKRLIIAFAKLSWNSNWMEKQLERDAFCEIVRSQGAWECQFHQCTEKKSSHWNRKTDGRIITNCKYCICSSYILHSINQSSLASSLRYFVYVHLQRALALLCVIFYVYTLTSSVHVNVHVRMLRLSKACAREKWEAQ